MGLNSEMSLSGAGNSLLPRPEKEQIPITISLSFRVSRSTGVASSAALPTTMLRQKCMPYIFQVVFHRPYQTIFLISLDIKKKCNN